MINYQPHVTTSDGKRSFACSPAAILVYIVDDQGRVLLLAHPKREGAWEVVNGGLEAGETVLEGALRETREEAGPDVRVRPLGAVHITTFHYDENVRYMLSLAYLMAYEGGEVQPGNDMVGSEYRWWRPEELAEEGAKLLVPPDGKWLLERAVDLYRLWKDQEAKPLQSALEVPQESKPK